MNKILSILICASLLVIGWAEGSTGQLTNKLTEIRNQYFAEQARPESGAPAAESSTAVDIVALADAKRAELAAEDEALEAAEARRRERKERLAAAFPIWEPYSADKWAAVRELDAIVLDMITLPELIRSGDWDRYVPYEQRLKAMPYMAELARSSQALHGFTLYHAEDFSIIDPREVLAFMKEYRDTHLPTKLAKMGPELESWAECLTWLQAAAALKKERQNGK